MLHSIPLSRTVAFCGGSSSLVRLPIPMSTRVCWTACGTTLSVKTMLEEISA